MRTQPITQECFLPRSTRLLVTAFLVLAPWPAVYAALTPPPTVDRIVERYIAARGGIEKIRGVRNLILRGPPRPGGKPGRFMARARPCYYLVGEPSPTRDFAEGNDGAPWEYYADPGLVLRTTGAPAAAARHTGYFDDPLVCSLDPGWHLELLGSEKIGERPAYRLRATYPDSFQTELFVDERTWLIIANRKSAPIHAFGEAVKTETRIGDYRNIHGALFATTFREYLIETGKPLNDQSGTWTSIEANVDLPPGYFSPPPAPDTPLARMLNAAFAARSIPTDALGWYRDFRTNPATAGIDTEAGIEAVGFQCLKSGAVTSAILLLETNLREHPKSATAHFGLGRAYRTAGREKDAVARFREALVLDPTYRRAADALAESSPARD